MMADVIIDGPTGARHEDLDELIQRAGHDELIRLAADGVPEAADEWHRRKAEGTL